MRKTLLLYAFTLLSISYASAQEVCDDGIDNDGDGFIDCYDSDCSDNKACDGFFLGNDASCEAVPSEFPKFLLELGYQSEDHVTNNLSRIAIGDLDRDGIPEILTQNTNDDRIYLLNGNDATIKYEATVKSPKWRASMANVQDDDCGEVFIVHYDANSDFVISSYDCELNHLWTTEALPKDPVFLSFADFDGDGKPELFYKDEIRDAVTGTRIIKNAGINWNNIPAGPVAVDIQGDEDLELVLGDKIYSVDLGNRTQDAGSLTLLATMPGNNYQRKSGGYASAESSTTSVADYNLDGYLDVVVTGANAGNVSSAFLWDVKNNTVKVFNDAFGTGDYQYGWRRGIGRVNIADLDGDGQLNAAFVSGKYLYALDENWNQLWRVVVNEETSGTTGCTLFDFNGDGKSEVVYRDEDYLYIINGNNGSVNTSVPCRSRTNIEYPIVADVDADGSTEICVVCASEDHKPGTKGASLGTGTPAEVRVYISAGEPWVPARRLWNQHGYFNVNINDDLSVPKRQQKHHLVWSENICEDGKKSRPLNGFLNQSPFLDSDGCPTYASPDLSIIQSSFSVTPPNCPDENFTVSFDFTNLGDVALTGNVPVTFYQGDPMAAGATKLNTDSIALNKFEVGQVGSAIDLVVHGTGAQFTLYAVLNDNGSTMPSPITFPSTNFLECDYDNNIVSAEINPIPFALSTEQTNNLTCAGDNVPASGSASVYRLVGTDKETADYDFFWYDSTSVGSPADADFTGAIYTGLSAGTYTVFALAKGAGCSSDTVQVVIQDSARVIDAEITVNRGNDDCKNPNGKLTVSVEDANGDKQPAGNFTYEWYIGNAVGGGLLTSTSHVATGLDSLTYTVVVTEKTTKCQTITSSKVPSTIVIPTVTTKVTDIVCSDSNSGSLEASVGGVTAGYTFEWFKGTSEKPTADYTGSTVTNLPKGSYTVKVTNNASSCASTLSTVEIEQTLVPEIDDITSTENNSCDPSKPNGSATVSIVGNVADHTIEWFKGATTAASAAIGTGLSVDELAAGVYTAKVTNKDTKCSVTDRVTVISNIVQPVIEAKSSPVTKCSPFDGKVEATPVNLGSASDYTFYWYAGKSVKPSTDFSETGNTLEELEPGFYTVQAFHNTRNCLADAVTIEVIDQAIIAITQTDAVISIPSDCSTSDGVLEVKANSPGNTSGFLLEWYMGATPTGTPFLSETGVKISQASGLITGLYTVVATDLDNGCSNSQIFNLPYADAHELTTLSVTNAITCSPKDEGSIKVELIPTTLAGYDESNYTLNLYANNDLNSTPVALAGVAGDAEYTFSGLGDGTYIIEALADATLGNCSIYSFATIELEATDPIVKSITKVANTNCDNSLANGSIEIDIDGGLDPLLYTINWYEGNDTSAPILGTSIGSTSGTNGEIATGLIGGNYTVEVSDNATNCSTIRTYSVVENPIVVSIPTSDLEITPITRCDINDSEVRITNVYENGSVANMSDYTFEWYDAAGTVLASNTNSISALAEGSYSVRAINTSRGCETSLIEFVIEDEVVEPTISMTFAHPQQCVTPNTGELHVTATAPSTNFSYSWYNGSSATGSVVQTGPDYVGLDEGFYTVAIVDSTSNCTYIETYELVTQVNTVHLSTSATAVTNCDAPNGTVFATVTSAGNYSYNWTDANGNSIGTTKEVRSLPEGEYTVVVTDNTDASCGNTATVMVTNEQITPPLAVTQIAPISVCDMTMANGAARALVDGGYIGYTFEWFEGSSATGDVIYVGPEYSQLKDITYTIRVTDNLTQCFNDETITITAEIPEVEDPTIELLSNDTHCQIDNGALRVDVGGNIANYRFNWFKGDNAKGTALTTGDRISNLSAGSYTVVATDLRTGCVSAAVTASIIEELVYPEFNIETQGASCNESNGSASVFMVGAAEIARIEWYNSFGSLVGTGPLLDGVPAGDYTVSVVTLNDCVTKEEVSIPSEINVYNGISRSGGDSNSFFKIDCITNFPNNNVKIYNRAGTLLYEVGGYNNTSIRFDGVSNKGINVLGDNVPDGTYFYVIEKNDGSKPQTGYLEIVN